MVFSSASALKYLHGDCERYLRCSFGWLCFRLHAACHEEMAAVRPYWELCVSRCDPALIKLVPTRLRLGFQSSATTQHDNRNPDSH